MPAICEGAEEAVSGVRVRSGGPWRGRRLFLTGWRLLTTQTFGLGMFEEVTEAALEEMEEFFRKRGTSTMHEVCPHAGVAVLEMLCRRGYAPMEVSNVLYRAVEWPEAPLGEEIRVRAVGVEEAELWGAVSARGWTHEHPELRGVYAADGSVVCGAREQSPCFLAEVDGVAGAAGGLVMYEGVALFAGAATVPELRRRGLQGALLAVRMRYAAEAGCDLAMMVTAAGSESQRNAERKGFRVGYTRMKWRLDSLTLRPQSFAILSRRQAQFLGLSLLQARLLFHR